MKTIGIISVFPGSINVLGNRKYHGFKVRTITRVNHRIALFAVGGVFLKSWKGSWRLSFTDEIKRNPG